MEILNIKKFIYRLGSERLSKIIGTTRLNQLSNISQKNITERNMVELIINRYGSQLFSNTELRRLIIASLPNTYKHYILTGTFDDEVISDTDNKKLLSLNWDRRINAILRLIQIFDLSEKYLPPVPINKPDLENVIGVKPMFDYQYRVKVQLLENLKTNDRVIVHMPTGSGKTKTSIESVLDYWKTNNPNSFIVWLAHTEELCEQAFEKFQELWNLRGQNETKIYRLFGDHNPIIDDKKSGILIVSYKKLFNIKNSRNDEVFHNAAKIKQNTSVIILDEAHLTVAPTFNEAIDYIHRSNKTKIIGLSATPGRGMNDDENRRLASFFNENKISLSDENYNIIKDPIKYLQDGNFLAKINAEEVASNFSYQLSENERDAIRSQFNDFSDAVLKSLAEDEERNLCIIAQIAEQANKNKSIIVFACSLEHAGLLNELCSLYEISSAAIDKDTSKYQRRLNIEKYKNKEISVLINYGVLTTGFDAPNTEVVIIARPTMSPTLYQQMLGRGIRGVKVGGNKECTLIDIKDNLDGLPDERRGFIMYNNYWN
tara:strand:- start:116 stop:1747 length:1632 start_codon:yes stop_codon:yes gene_type:complete